MGKAVNGGVVVVLAEALAVRYRNMHKWRVASLRSAYTRSGRATAWAEGMEARVIDPLHPPKV